ncbi:hypothetical protein [[Mycobacterium] nativiensis]|uniref:Transposase n=1 Tax=[Mycobacterium] nativiensis TaxID=2855503 RepID=A0ABU5Y155_9MYCO|nr:hypothetical protein [Mycolicibacter sp. MYC340]MEB3033979.1 hypothetical protein [Mycolicibacter sp. MYC340]
MRQQRRVGDDGLPSTSPFVGGGSARTRVVKGQMPDVYLHGFVRWR